MEMQSTPSSGWYSQLSSWEMKLEWTLGTRAPQYTLSREVSSDCSQSQTWLSLQMWRSLASFLHEVDELVGSLFYWFWKHSGTLCGRYQFWGHSKDTHLHPILAVQIFCKFCHATHTQSWGLCIQTDLFVLFQFGKTKSIWLETPCFVAEPVASVVASLVWWSTRSKGR